MPLFRPIIAAAALRYRHAAIIFAPLLPLSRHAC